MLYVSKFKDELFQAPHRERSDESVPEIECPEECQPESETVRTRENVVE
jgi:hypothetical protein